MHPEITGKKEKNVPYVDGIDRASGSSRRETPAAEDTTVVAATPLSNFIFS
jgi:hypothetical protein